MLGWWAQEIVASLGQTRQTIATHTFCFLRFLHRFTHLLCLSPRCESRPAPPASYLGFKKRFSMPMQFNTMCTMCTMSMYVRFTFIKKKISLCDRDQIDGIDIFLIFLSLFYHFSSPPGLLQQTLVIACQVHLRLVAFRAWVDLVEADCLRVWPTIPWCNRPNQLPTKHVAMRGETNCQNWRNGRLEPSSLSISLISLLR